MPNALIASPHILRLGRYVVAHFAQRPQATRTSHSGEIRAHLDGKCLLLDVFRACGLRAKAAFSQEPVLTTGGPT